MQLRARTQTTTASSAATAVTIKTETMTTTTTTKRSPRSKRPSQALDGVALKTESSVASATTVSRSVKRRAVALAYDNGDDGAVKVELKQDELGQVVSVDNVSPVADTTKVKPAVASPQKKKRASKTDEMRVKREQPAQWEAMLSGIQAMRAKRKAEVDTMGCEVRERIVASCVHAREAVASNV